MALFLNKGTLQTLWNSEKDLIWEISDSGQNRSRPTGEGGTSAFKELEEVAWGLGKERRIGGEVMISRIDSSEKISEAPKGNKAESFSRWMIHPRAFQPGIAWTSTALKKESNFLPELRKP